MHSRHVGEQGIGKIVLVCTSGSSGSCCCLLVVYLCSAIFMQQLVYCSYLASSAKLICVCTGENKPLAVPVYFVLVDMPSKMYTNMAASVISPAHAMPTARGQYVLGSRFYMGQVPEISVMDVNLIKLVTVKDFDSFINRPIDIQIFPDLLQPKKPKDSERGLMCSRDDHWREARQAFSSAFSSSKIKAVCIALLCVCVFFTLPCMYPDDTSNTQQCEDTCGNPRRTC